MPNIIIGVTNDFQQDNFNNIIRFVLIVFDVVVLNSLNNVFEWRTAPDYWNSHVRILLLHYTDILQLSEKRRSLQE